jgi:hypothetical protein
VPETIVVGNGGTFGGGAGGGAQSNWLSTQAPRLTMEVRFVNDVIERMPPMVSRPPRSGVLRTVRVMPDALAAGA